MLTRPSTVCRPGMLRLLPAHPGSALPNARLCAAQCKGSVLPNAKALSYPMQGSALPNANALCYPMQGSALPNAGPCAAYFKALRWPCQGSALPTAGPCSAACCPCFTPSRCMATIDDPWSVCVCTCDPYGLCVCMLVCSQAAKHYESLGVLVEEVSLPSFR